MALGSIQPLKEMSIRNFFWGGEDNGRPARKTDNVSAVCEPIL
jgi:hypothetical protein